jgi:hypothetical protein
MLQGHARDDAKYESRYQKSDGWMQLGPQNQQHQQGNGAGRAKQ